jgi:hypothetical protein
MKSIHVAAITDGQQRVLRDAESPARVLVKAISLLRCADGDDGVVAIVATRQIDTYQTLGGL